MNYVDDKHVQSWLAEHDSALLPAAMTAEFAQVLEKLPWIGPVLDWSAIGVIRLSLDSPDFWNDVNRTKLGPFAYGFLMYSGGEPGIVARLCDILQGLDVLTWKAPGDRFFCAATRVNEWTLEPQVFGAYDGADHLLIRA